MRRRLDPNLIKWLVALSLHLPALPPRLSFASSFQRFRGAGSLQAQEFLLLFLFSRPSRCGFFSRVELANKILQASSFKALVLASSQLTETFPSFKVLQEYLAALA
jgi:hypothetical protein